MYEKLREAVVAEAGFDGCVTWGSPVAIQA
jgi:hypothetical protein